MWEGMRVVIAIQGEGAFASWSISKEQLATGSRRSLGDRGEYIHVLGKRIDQPLVEQRTLDRQTVAGPS